MTQFNTIIEEYKKEFKNYDYEEIKEDGETLYRVYQIPERDLNSIITSAMQRAHEAGRISWLRSEIERVDRMKRNLNPRGQEFQELHEQYNLAITHIITPWKEELAELEKTQ